MEKHPHTHPTESIHHTSHPSSDHPKQLSIIDLLPLWLPITPLKKQPQFLQSPSPVRKDLFHQLLGTDAKQSSPTYQTYILEQPNSLQESNLQESIEDEDQINWGDDGWSEEGVKKRKRKSTNQIKMLKEEMDGQMNWSKDKIIKMAQLTGLSQSQVYKWCWDQKKKQNKHLESKSFFQRRKQARRQLPNQNYYCQTNLKISHTTEDSINTHKKLNKKLIFN